MALALGTFWAQHNTPISIVLGPFLTIIVFRMVKAGMLLKCTILAASILALVGVLGLIKNLVLAFVLATAYFVGWVAIWIGGFIVFGLLGVFDFSNYTWWQKIIFGGVWFIASLVADYGLRFLLAYIGAGKSKENS